MARRSSPQRVPIAQLQNDKHPSAQPQASGQARQNFVDGTHPSISQNARQAARNAASQGKPHTGLHGESGSQTTGSKP